MLNSNKISQVGNKKKQHEIASVKVPIKNALTNSTKGTPLKFE